jgi:hypothetical protein
LATASAPALVYKIQAAAAELKVAVVLENPIIGT